MHWLKEQKEDEDVLFEQFVVGYMIGELARWREENLMKI